MMSSIHGRVLGFSFSDLGFRESFTDPRDVGAFQKRGRRWGYNHRPQHATILVLLPSERRLLVFGNSPDSQAQSPEPQIQNPKP